MADGAIINRRGQVKKIPEAVPNPRVRIVHTYPRRKRSSTVGDFSDMAVNAQYRDRLEFGETDVLTVDDVRKKARQTLHLLTRPEQAVAAEHRIAGFRTITMMSDARKAANTHARSVCLVSKIDDHFAPVPGSEVYTKNFSGRWRANLFDREAISRYGRRSPYDVPQVVGLDAPIFGFDGDDDDFYDDNVIWD